MKLAPVHRNLAARDAPLRIVHTGQHYDERMSDVFFRELGIPQPDVHLDVGSGSHGAQTARILERYERLLEEARPACTVVFGDVNSTVACALAATKLQVPVVHVEAGLRSFDRTMPEEVNRLLTDAVADLLLVSEPAGLQNLAREGIPDAKVRFVGNVMIDSLLENVERAREAHAPEDRGLVAGEYGLVTMHRPSNVDDAATLRPLLELLRELSDELPLVFPVHPRTRNAAERTGLAKLLDPVDGRYFVTEPVPYLEILALMAGAKIVLTDSGGMQEETSTLGVPCLTLRDNTERPVTVDLGTSRLVGNDVAAIRESFREVVAGRWRQSRGIPLWDGGAGARVADAILEWLPTMRAAAAAD